MGQMKQYRKISELYKWAENPRAVTIKSFDRLINQIQELGQYKPLLVTKQGEILGGNMRYEAYKKLGIEDVWVSEVEPKNDAEKLKYAISDNDEVGYYVEQDLTALISRYKVDINLESYHVNLGHSFSLKELLDKITPYNSNDNNQEDDQKNNHEECDGVLYKFDGYFHCNICCLKHKIKEENE